MNLAGCSDDLKDINRVKNTGQKETTGKCAKRFHQKEINQITVEMAHEMQNSLTVIKGYLQFLKNKPETYRQKSQGVVFQEVDRIEMLLTNFILMNRNERAGQSIQNLNGLLQEIYPTIQAYAIRYGMRTEMLLYDKLPMIAFSAEEMKQLVMNLIRNGMETMNPGGRLTIGTTREPGKVVLFVRNEGRGTLVEEMNKMSSTPFHMERNGSLGLAFAVSCSIAERYQGKIEIVTNKKAGDTVRILFTEYHILPG